MKIVIAGTSVYGIGNLGDEALLKVLVDNLRSENVDADITLLARHPGEYLDSYFGLKSIPNVEYPRKKDSLGKWFRGLNPGDDTEHLRRIVEELKEADLFIIGGDPFNELSMGFGWGLMPHATLLVTLAKFLQVPTALYGIHMGRPLKTEIGKEMTKFCVSNCQRVTLREKFSEDVLREIGISTDNCVVLSDPAFGLEPIADTKPGTDLMGRLGLSPNGKALIGVNFRHEYWHWKSEKWDPFRAAVAVVCDDLVQRLDADILFIPNSSYDKDADIQLYQDDRPANRDVVEMMKYANRAHLIEAQLNLTETMSLFPLLDMHISSRRHSLVFAAIHDVPFVAIGAGGPWHIGPAVEELDVPDSFMDVETLSEQNLLEKTSYVWSKADDLKSRMKSALPALRDKARAHASHILEIARP